MIEPPISTKAVGMSDWLMMWILDIDSLIIIIHKNLFMHDFSTPIEHVKWLMMWIPDIDSLVIIIHKNLFMYDFSTPIEYGKVID